VGYCNFIVQCQDTYWLESFDYQEDTHEGAGAKDFSVRNASQAKLCHKPWIDLRVIETIIIYQDTYSSHFMKE